MSSGILPISPALGLTGLQQTRGLPWARDSEVEFVLCPGDGQQLFFFRPTHGHEEIEAKVQWKMCLFEFVEQMKAPTRFSESSLISVFVFLLGFEEILPT